MADVSVIEMSFVVDVPRVEKARDTVPFVLSFFPLLPLFVPRVVVISDPRCPPIYATLVASPIPLASSPPLSLISDFVFSTSPLPPPPPASLLCCPGPLECRSPYPICDTRRANVVVCIVLVEVWNLLVVSTYLSVVTKENKCRYYSELHRVGRGPCSNFELG